jgi:NAD(P)-dependent dehydrogenase (short-subunit alcohol dehydrogenase family)
VARRCDVTSWPDQQALVRTALERFGQLGAYLANAGFGATRGFPAPLHVPWVR